MRRLVLCVIFFYSVLSFGQDLHLSQFYTNKMKLNPALAGHYEGSYQFTGNYRNQWREVGIPLNTVFFALDKHFFFFSDEINVGLLVADDQYAGFNQKTSKFLLNGAYTKRFGSHKVSAGIQMGAVLRSTDLSNQTFPNQWIYSQGVFDQNVYNGEANLGLNQGFFDLNLGVVWTKKYNNLEPLVGFTLFHINRPKDTYLVTFIERLRMRKSFFAQLDWRLENNVSVEPKLLYMWTTKAQDLVVGSNFKKHINAKLVKNIYAGVHMRAGFARNVDAVFPTIGFTIDRFDAGFSYDINVSEISQYNERKSSLEWSLVYTFPLYNPAKLSIPCDRY